MKKNRIGIIILNYISYEETISCVNSVEYNTDYEIQIYIVDNASPNESYRVLNETFIDFKHITVISNKINSGYSAGNNVGIKKAQDDGCDYYLISNSDIIFHKRSISIMYEFLRDNSHVGLVGPKILNFDGTIHQRSRMFSKTTISVKLFARSSIRVFNYKNIYRSYYGLDFPYDENIEVYSLMGCCFMMSSEMVKKVMPYDENTFLYEEEMILGIKAAESGLKSYYVPEAVVTHYHQGSSKHIGAFALIHLVNSEMYYCKTYLKASVLKIIPVYSIRVSLYLFLCLKDSSYRKNIFVFLRQSLKRLFSKNGLI